MLLFLYSASGERAEIKREKKNPKQGLCYNVSLWVETQDCDTGRRDSQGPDVISDQSWLWVYSPDKQAEGRPTHDEALHHHRALLCSFSQVWTGRLCETVS